MFRAGHWHSTVSLRWDIGTIAKRLAEVSPDVIWGHMLLWPPDGRLVNTQTGQSKLVDLLCLCADWRKRGARVLLHDGDARDETRFPTDVSPAVDLALCNHTADRSAWKIPQLRWPYFAFDQARIADPVEEFRCDLAFAGRLDDSPLYAERTRLVRALKAKLGDRMKVFPTPEMTHTLFRTPELAASAGAILGYGRPGRNGWLDVRTFQYPGAGGVLLSDDVDGYLEPGYHYVAYESGSVDSVMKALEEALEIGRLDRLVMSWGLRRRAFDDVQQSHSATARVREALAAVGLAL